MITSATPPFRLLEKPLFGSAPGPLSDQRELWLADFVRAAFAKFQTACVFANKIAGIAQVLPSQFTERMSASY